MRSITKTALTIGALLAAVGNPAFGQTKTITYQGVLEVNGQPFPNEQVPIIFSISDDPNGTNKLAISEVHYATVDPETGLFVAEPTLTQLPGRAPAFGEGERWLGMSVSGRPLTPLSRIRPAMLADDVVASAKSWQVYPTGNAGFLPSGYAAIGQVTIHKDGRIGVGTTSPQAALDVRGWTRTQVLQITGGSDIAEPFNVEGEAKPGMVVSIDPERVGEMRVSESAYDKRVAGIISGAGGVRPGLTLTQEDAKETQGDHPVALTGRVWCYVDADANGPIEPGDLLTTSDTPGHAMKAVDAERSNGAIIGKAMSSLEEGRGLVLVLVNLQ